MGHFVSMPSGIQDLFIHVANTSAIGYIVLLHLQLYQLFPILVILPACIIGIIIHFIIVSGKADAKLRLAKLFPIRSNCNHKVDIESEIPIVNDKIDDKVHQTRRASLQIGLDVIDKLRNNTSKSSESNSSSGSNSNFMNDADSDESIEDHDSDDDDDDYSDGDDDNCDSDDDNDDDGDSDDDDENDGDDVDDYVCIDHSNAYVDDDDGNVGNVGEESNVVDNDCDNNNRSERNVYHDEKEEEGEEETEDDDDLDGNCVEEVDDNDYDTYISLDSDVSRSHHSHSTHENNITEKSLQGSEDVDDEICSDDIGSVDVDSDHS
jgi:hypothetical protein